ncbi:hypothetical protein GVAV_001851 [Gurleya vavrai]
MNDLNFPKSGKIQKIIINSYEVSFFEVYKILSTNKSLIINNVVEFDYKIPFLEHTNSPNNNFLEIFKSINKKTEIESSESFKLNKNFLMTINNHDIETSIYIIRRIFFENLHEFLSDTELKFKFKIYIDYCIYEKSELSFYYFTFNNFHLEICYNNENHIAFQTEVFFYTYSKFFNNTNILLLCKNTFSIINKNITNNIEKFADIFDLEIKEFFRTYKLDNCIT